MTTRAGSEARLPETAPVYTLLTNRNNLLEILSSGLIKPASLYSKYYPDLGASCPGAVPLLLRDPTPVLVRETVGEEPAMFPVLIDLDMEEGEEVHTIFDDYQQGPEENLTHGGGVCAVFETVIPTGRIQAIHFRSDDEIREHSTRKYENVREDAVPLRVSPERFQGRRINVKRLLPALSRTQDEITAIAPEELARAESLGGALLMLTGLAERSNTLPLEDLIPPLEALRTLALGEELGQIPDNMLLGSSSVTGSLPLVFPALLRRETAAPEEMITPEMPGAEEEPELEMYTRHGVADTRPRYSLEGVFTLSALLTLFRFSPESFYGEAALDVMYYTFAAEVENLVSDRARHPPQRYLELLENMKAILGNMADIEDFPATESLAAKGLLNFLMRGDPARVMSWATQDMGHDPAASAVAVACSGTLYGRARVPVECRPSIAFESYMDEVLAGYLNRESIETPTRMPASLSTIRTEEHGCEVETLAAGGEPLVYRRKDLPSSADVAASSVGTAQATRPEGSGFSHGESKTERLYEEVPDVLLSSSLENGPEKEAAVLLCNLAGWNDCVITVISPDVPGAVVTDMARSEVRVEGFVSTKMGIRLERFRRRLSKEEWNELTGQQRDQVKKILHDS